MSLVLAGVGLGAGGRWWSDSWSRADGRTGSVAAVASGAQAAAALKPPHLSETTPGSARADESPSLETVEGILAAEGFERAERLGRFLISAQPADLERLLLGLSSERGFVEMTLGDAIFLRWMTIDAAGGLAFVEQREGGAFSSMAWWAWGKTDPDAALAAALDKPDPWVGTMVVRAIAQSDPLRAREILAQHPRFEEQSAMEGLASGMMKVDPTAGATLAAAWNYSIDQENRVSGWARREPEAALAWAQSLPDLTRRAEALRVVLGQWTAVHPEKVGPAIDALPDGRTKWKLYAEHAKRLAATDPEAARAWVDAAATPLLRREATFELARGLTASDPSAALDALRGIDWSLQQEALSRQHILTPNGESIFGSSSQAGTIMGEISAVAPAETLAFVASLPAGAPVQNLAQYAFGTWVNNDPLAASTWLAEQPAGEIRHVATESLAIHLSGGSAPDFEAAAQWALTLPRDQGINNAVNQVFRRWREQDQAGAQAFLDRPDCPPEIRAAFAPPLPNP